MDPKPFVHYRVASDQYPKKLMLRRIIFCHYLRFIKVRAIRPMKLNLLRYLKNFKRCHTLKIKDELTKPWGIYRQILNANLHNIREICFASPNNVNGLFKPLKQLRWMAVSSYAKSSIRFHRKLVDILTSPQATTSQRHLQKNMTDIQIRSSTSNDLSSLIPELEMQKLQKLKSISIFYNCPQNSIPTSLQFGDQSYWRKLRWAYLTFRTPQQLEYFCSKVDHLVNIDNIELVYHGGNDMSNFPFEEMSNFQFLERCRVFTMQFDLQAVKNQMGFWKNLRFPSKIESLGLSLTKLTFKIEDSISSDFIDLCKFPFMSLSQIKCIHASFGFVENFTETHSEIISEIFREMPTLEEISLDPYFNYLNETNMDNQTFHLGKFMPAMKQMEKLKALHIQGNRLDQLSLVDNITNLHKDFTSLSLLSPNSILGETQIFQFFDGIDISNLTRLRMNYMQSLNQEHFDLMVNYIGKMVKLEHLVFMGDNSYSEESVKRLGKTIQMNPFLYTIKVKLTETDLSEEAQEFMTDVFKYHTYLLNIEFRGRNYRYYGNDFRYKVF